MHAAPSVTYPVGRSAFAAALVGALVLCGLVAAAAWSLQAGHIGWRQWTALVTVLACGAFALASWWRAPRGRLRWDGGAWQWEEGGRLHPGRLEIAFDLQARMLLRWQGETGRAQWFWAERKSNLADWDGFRRAVYSRAEPPEPVPTTGQPPAAEQ